MRCYLLVGCETLSAVSSAQRRVPSHLLYSHAISCIELRHVGDDHAVSDLKTGFHFNRVDRSAAELNTDTLGFAFVPHDLEDSDGAFRLTEAGAANEEHVRKTLDLDCAVDREVRPRSLR